MLLFESYIATFSSCIATIELPTLFWLDSCFKINYKFSLNVHIVAERCLGEIEKLFDPVDLKSVKYSSVIPSCCHDDDYPIDISEVWSEAGQAWILPVLRKLQITGLKCEVCGPASTLNYLLNLIHQVVLVGDTPAYHTVFTPTLFIWDLQN